MLANPFIHQFLPLGSAFLPLVLAATVYANKQLRPMVGGFSIGTAAFLLGTFLTGFHAGPFGWLGMLTWTLANVMVMGVLARLTLDSTKNKS
jgi:ABC-type thiamin/hydroxymethylpyrimidine transport system permease subunit